MGARTQNTENAPTTPAVKKPILFCSDAEIVEQEQSELLSPTENQALLACETVIRRGWERTSRPQSRTSRHKQLIHAWIS